MLRHLFVALVAVVCLCRITVADTPTVARVYAISDLPVFSSEEFDPSVLIAYVKLAVDPESWQDGIGAVAVYERNLSVVITQTEQNHEQIKVVLEGLRSKDGAR